MLMTAMAKGYYCEALEEGASDLIEKFEQRP
jgi:hypothetical protein